MNREILFRAKRIDNGGWVYGHYAIIGKRDVIVKTENEEFYSVDEDLKKKSGNEVIEIQKDTICEYTGLTDKNGRKIFERDILRFENCSNYPVVWDDYYCAFGSCWYSDFDHLGKYRSIEIEVVGNIFDNPELLEQG